MVSRLAGKDISEYCMYQREKVIKTRGSAALPLPSNKHMKRLSNHENEYIADDYSFSIVVQNSQSMAFLRKLFVSAPAPSAKQAALSALKLLKIDSAEPLPDNYHETLFPSGSPHRPAEILREVVHSLPLAASEAAIIKLYTIIMCAVRVADYGEEQCEALEELQEAGRAARGGEVERSCRSYLAKLPSMRQLYECALSAGQRQRQEGEGEEGEGHTALFRLMNQFSLLFPVLNSAINTAGRYYRETLLYYKEFYRVWRAEVLLGYLHLKRAVDDFCQNYRKEDAAVLACFVRSLPEIELLCDQMEAFLTNKYFRGKSPNKKVSFSEEALQEIEYYLAGLERAEKEEDFIRTADDDFFATPYS